MVKPVHIIGIMSGTSMDGVDAVLAQIERDIPKTLAKSFIPYDDFMRNELLALNVSGPDELHRAALAGNRVASLYAGAVADVLAQAGLDARQVSAIGAHGQTVRHRPDQGYSAQLLNGALLAEVTGIRTICDFRARDIAASGQGAPLVPAFHAAMFGDALRRRIVLNLGGIANITALTAGCNDVTGFDCGPANVLLDYWCERHFGTRFDADGAWAHSGTPIPAMLTAMLADAFFARPPPKSTGRDLFQPDWLMRFRPDQYCAADVQATLLALTITSITNDIVAHAPNPDDVLVCGGGALNAAMMQALAQRLAPARVVSTADFGIDPLTVEALAFAWLAWRCLEGLPGNLPEVTGARGLRVLGAIHPA